MSSHLFEVPLYMLARSRHYFTELYSCVGECVLRTGFTVASVIESMIETLYEAVLLPDLFFLALLGKCGNISIVTRNCCNKHDAT